MSRFQYKVLSLAMAVLFLVSMLYVGREAAAYAAGRNVVAQEEKICVVIDAGHGGTLLRPEKAFAEMGGNSCDFG